MFCRLFACFSIVVLPGLARAQEGPVDFIGGFSIGYARLNFPAKLDSTPTFPSYTLTGSASLDKLYASLSYGASFSDEDISEEEDIGEASRTDLDFTIGYRINDSWTVYAGLKDSETDIDFRMRETINVRDEYYRQEGIFVGANYRLDLDVAGSLTFNFAYSDLDTDDKFLQDEDCLADPDECEEPEEFDDLTGKHSGEADGWSYGVSWLIPLNRHMAFNSTIKVNDYQEDIKYEGVTYSADQKMTFFNIGVLVSF